MLTQCCNVAMPTDCIFCFFGCILSADDVLVKGLSLPDAARFNACSLEGEEQFMLMGLVLGLAIYNRVLLDFPLPLPLYKKLLSQPVGLRDLEEMQPMLGRSLRQLLHYDGPSVEVSDT